jgi:pimeloyl-ACP methyl ester carboxylesterase
LCRLLNRHGITALRLSLAYHDRRMPGELRRADYHVSSNLGRTIQAARQSTIDARACLDWLTDNGYQRIGILGSSLGSCIALLVTAHDPRIRVAVFNHVSLNFGDVVWTGISCRHIRQVLADHLTQEELVRYWSVISPSAYLNRLKGRDLQSLLVWADRDTSFLPAYSRQALEAFGQLGLPHKVVCLPCGHYTSGKMPFALWDGLVMCRFLRKCL